MRTRKKKRKAKTVIIPETRRCVPRSLSVTPLVVLILLLPFLCAHSQVHNAGKHAKEPYALIFGTVWGPDERPVYGVRVKIRRAGEKKPKWELVSDHRGEFAQRVPPGKADYLVTADTRQLKTADGKPLHLVQDAPVHVENDERVDIGLHLSK